MASILDRAQPAASNTAGLEPPGAPQASGPQVQTALTDFHADLKKLLDDCGVPAPLQEKLKTKRIFTVEGLGVIGGGVASVACALLGKALGVEDEDLLGHSSIAMAWTRASTAAHNPQPKTNDLDHTFLPNAEFELGKGRFRKENGGALPPPEHYLEPRTWGRLFNELGSGFFKVWPHRRVLTRADIDSVSAKDGATKTNDVEEVNVHRTAAVIDKETALLYGYVFLGVAHKPTADVHIRKLVQLARDPEKYSTTIIINVVTRIRSHWQSRIMDEVISVEAAIQETNARDDLWNVKASDKMGDHLRENSGKRSRKGKPDNAVGKGDGKAWQQAQSGGSKRKFDNSGPNNRSGNKGHASKWEGEDWKSSQASGRNAWSGGGHY